MLASDAFNVFAEATALEEALEIEVARTVALYRLNDQSLEVTSTDPEELKMFRRRLLEDTVVRLRAQIPAEAWVSFDESGLLPGAKLTEGVMP